MTTAATKKTVQEFLTYRKAHSFYFGQYLDFRFKLRDFVKAAGITQADKRLIITDPAAASRKGFGSEVIATISSYSAIMEHNKLLADDLHNQYHNN